MAVLGGPLLAVVLWFFDKTGKLAWLYAWGIVIAFQLTVMFLAPILIMPLFNRFTPLPEGELKKAIEGYAKSQDFKLKGIFTMDGSKRSSKSNAFFTGFGKFRRIVLYDTLVANHSVDQLVAIVAHEMGHFKQKHIHKMVLLATISMGIMFYILSHFLNNKNLFAAFGMDHLSVYASLIFFSFLYSPLSTSFSIFMNFLSRKFEFQADHFARQSGGGPGPLDAALKKLSSDNLTNLTPHPLKVFWDYSHPPVLERIRALTR